MFVVESYPLAVLFCVVTMLCWGSWANTQKACGSKWRFELFYWDYVLGIVLTALLFAFTLGSSGTAGRGFLEDVRQASGAAIGYAVLGGVIFNAANILLVAAIDIAGMSVGFPVGIALALILGVLNNYMVRPQGNVPLLIAGVAAISVAIVLDAMAYRRLPSQGKGLSTKGLVLSLLCGVLMSFFYRFVAQSMSEKFVELEPGKFGPYSAVVFFSLGLLASNFLFNWFIMRVPFNGPPVGCRDYCAGSASQHLLGVVGGAIWCVGMTLSIIASAPATPAVSYGLGQGATMVAAAWGVFIWREFRAAPPGTNRLLAVMFVCYLIGLALLIGTQI
jgi:glucose uptake protein